MEHTALNTHFYTRQRTQKRAIISAMESGGRTWARTKDPLIKSQLLYQLSYASMTWPVVGALERRRPRREAAN